VSESKELICDSVSEEQFISHTLILKLLVIYQKIMTIVFQ